MDAIQVIAALVVGAHAALLVTACVCICINACVNRDNIELITDTPTDTESNSNFLV